MAYQSSSPRTHVITLDSLGGHHTGVARVLGLWLQMEARTRKGIKRELGKLPTREAHVSTLYAFSRFILQVFVPGARRLAHVAAGTRAAQLF